jgi:DNA mismatch repair protein MutL
VVNQIAAGEVIERPSSVVKELLENALDAGAARIEIDIEQGGRDLIRVWDNGGGIPADDLPLAVAPHATSKLETADDLFRVDTFGFRGEALASIASVSHLRLQSRPVNQAIGSQIELRDTDQGQPIDCGCPAGTMVEVRNLFYNTPVRRRYLKAVQTEMGHIVEVFTRVAIARPELAVVLRHNNRTLFDLPSSAQLLERLTLFFGRELAEKLIWVDSSSEGHRIWGYAADPSQSRSNARTQYLFVNGRFIRDRSLSHALSEAYRSLLMVGRYPIAFLFMEVPAEEVDVNVHPTKIEVRFRDPQRHFRQLLSMLRQKFLATDLTARLQISTTPAPDEAVEPDMDRPALDDFFNRAADAATRRQPTEDAPQSRDVTGPQQSFQLRTPASPAQTTPLPFARPVSAQPLTGSQSVSNSPHAVDVPPSGISPVEPLSQAVVHVPRRASGQLAALQIHNAYIVVETPDGLMLIDQHALHERVLYEALRSRVLNGTLESQRLLVPELFELSAAEVALVSDCTELLQRLGMSVEPFGGTSVALHTYPAMLANLPADRMFRDIVDILVSGGETPTRRDLLDSLLHMISCKAAIKAGQRLTDEEIQSLVAQHDLAQDSHHCPHGRPTALVFSKAELEKQFKRT